ncbi:ZIP family metal transporter [Patescibacteria group bacterium]|nr:ZIP family metal transporter [Patescibacteria group bacterium]
MNVQVLILILLATGLISSLGFVGRMLFGIKAKILNQMLIYFVAFAAGSLLGGAFFHLLPTALETLPTTQVFTITSFGFIFMMIIEGYFHYHRCEECHRHPLSYTMLIGDGIHNLIDGLVISASFMTDIKLGIIATLVVLWHELPQELSVFGSLIYAGHSKKRSLILSMLAQSTVILGGVLGFVLSGQLQAVSTWLIAFAGGGFIYIAASDLVPEVHKAYGQHNWRSIMPMFTLLAGMGLMALLTLFE